MLLTLVAPPADGAEALPYRPVDGLDVPLLLAELAVPKRLRVVDVAIVAAEPESPLALPVLDLRPLLPPMKRLFSSPVEKAAPVLRTGDECVEDSADVLLSELDLLKRSVETRPTRLAARSDVSSAGDDVRDA